ncbi:PREDICTED: homeobox even-skipped homolog protein 1 [Pygoscelis adeliae]|uniref:homeobox even-skipped homolog protein 1 n=1 Tax=Pygoscelis adeliae TaxID=9238 RepID=UPI0004F4E64E|nr:PREDICTED: homeobox even-skipped homolog protein 1 [Pygoscelis adeliae]
METRKEMVMFLEGTQLGALVGKRVPNLSEAVGSPAPEPQEKMIHRNCLSPRPGPLSSRERGGGGGGGGEDEEEVEGEMCPGECGSAHKDRKIGRRLLPSPNPAAATGNLPSPFPSHLPLPYYSHMGIGATSASAATPFSTPLRPLDTFRVLSHPYPRPELLCAFRHPSLYPAPTHGLSSAGGNPCSCLACHSGQSNGLAQRPSGSDFTCSATTRTDSFLTFTPSVLSKATSVSMDQREEVPLTR